MMTAEPFEQRRPAKVWTVLSFAWALTPAISFGFLTPVTFAIAWVRCRTVTAFASLVGYAGLSYWLLTFAGFSGGPGAALQLLFMWALGTVHALLIRKNVLQGSAIRPAGETSRFVRPSGGRVFGSVVWALSPALSVGFLTPVTFVIALIRRRSLSSFLALTVYTGVYAWFFAVSSGPQGQNVAGVFVMSCGLVGAANAFVVRQQIWYRTVPRSDDSTSTQTRYEAPVPALFPFSAPPQPPGSYFTAPYPHTPESSPESAESEPIAFEIEKPPEPLPAPVEAESAPPESILEIPPLSDVLRPEPEAIEPRPEAAQDAAELDVANLGTEVCGSEAYRNQTRRVRRAPDPDTVAAVIYGAAKAGGYLTSAEIARIIEKPTASVDGYVVQMQRILNIDGSQVLQKVDGGSGVRIDLDLLRQQFLGGNR